MTEKFGFTVAQHRALDTDTFERVIVEGQWCVNLPHQCSAWDIAGEDQWEGVPHEQAVAELEKFIAEAQEALAALKEQREIGEQA